MKDERLVSKMEGKTYSSRRLKQFDGLTGLTPTPLFYDRSTTVYAVKTPYAHCRARYSMMMTMKSLLILANGTENCRVL